MESSREKAKPLEVLKKTHQNGAEGPAPGYEVPTLLGLAMSREEPDTCGGLQRNLNWSGV
jgi:hypothetical protein